MTPCDLETPYLLRIFNPFLFIYLIYLLLYSRGVSYLQWLLIPFFLYHNLSDQSEFFFLIIEKNSVRTSLKFENFKWATIKLIYISQFRSQSSLSREY